MTLALPEEVRMVMQNDQNEEKKERRDGSLQLHADVIHDVESLTPVSPSLVSLGTSGRAVRAFEREARCSKP